MPPSKGFSQKAIRMRSNTFKKDYTTYKPELGTNRNLCISPFSEFFVPFNSIFYRGAHIPILESEFFLCFCIAKVGIRG